MKIGIDISQMIYEGTGVARFTRGLVKAITQHDKENDWIFFFSSMRRSPDKEILKIIKKRGFKLVNYKVPPTALSVLWNSIHRLRIEKIVGKLDWFITSDWTEPPADSKKATIVHDLTLFRYPETVSKNIIETQTKRLSWVKKESKIIFADSNTTKTDLIKFLKIPKNKIKVIYPGVEIEKTFVKQKKIKPFILTVGKIEPRKNLKRLIEAFEKLNDSKIDLVIAGPKGWEDLKIKNKNIKFLGYVSDDELIRLYQSCLFFIYPSLWEGFGYPVVEAMSLGAPVGTSNTSSLREIGEGVAYLFDPHDSNEIYKALKELSTNEGLRKKLSSESRKRAQMFTWKNYYKEFINTLLKS